MAGRNSFQDFLLMTFLFSISPEVRQFEDRQTLLIHTLVEPIKHTHSEIYVNNIRFIRWISGYLGRFYKG